MFFDYSNLVMQYDPYPVGLVKPLMDEGMYREFVENFPPLELLASHAAAGRQGDKFTLSRKIDRRGYADFVRSVPVWSEFRRWIESDDFIYSTLQALADHHVDLGYRRLSWGRRFVEKTVGRVRGKVPFELSKLKARFEFSALSAVGGHLLPHTDSPGKIVTLVVSILGDEPWDRSVGGATDINLPLKDEHKFNMINDKAGFEEMAVAASYEYAPNQAVIFVKTHNSWHSVRPMTGHSSDDYRRTLTINIEATG